MAQRELTCKTLVGRVSDYLDGLLGADELPRWDHHLAGCADCRAHLSQMRLVVRALRALREEPLSAEPSERLLELFRSSGVAHGERAAMRVRLGLGLEEDYCDIGAHVAYFYESSAEFLAGVRFLETGLRGRDACVVFGHREANDRVLRALGKSFDVDALSGQSRLSVLGGGRTSGGMLSEIARTFQSGLETGAPCLRLLGNIGWGRHGWPSDDGILEFEARVTQAAKQFPCVIVCMYDVRSLAGRIVLKGGFETHPLVARSRVLRENPHFVPPERFLDELRSGSGLVH